MSDRVLQRCAIEFERFVVSVNDSRPDCRGIAYACVPWSRSPLSFTKSEIPFLLREVRAVLLAQARHAQVAPAWACPLPVGDEINLLLQSALAPMHLLGLYACSLMMLGYDYSGHPSLSTYGCGVMAHPLCPDHVRDDPELQAEFPARELPGLSGRMVWFGESLPAETRAELLGH